MSGSSDVIYMLYDDYGGLVRGPLLGKPGLNMESLVAEFRSESYAKAEAAADDYCVLLSSDLADWLIARGLLRTLDTVSLTASVDTSGDHAYAPAFWPSCPACRDGRGDTSMGRVLHSLNRADWHRKCTECGHTWDHHDEPYTSTRPMVDDDGRYIDSGCVPYAISQAANIQFDDVVSVCRDLGWSEGVGMAEDLGVLAAQRFGLKMIPSHQIMVAGKPTLRKVLDTLSPARTYIVSTRNHWLAVVRGESRDQGETHMRTEVSGFWEVMRNVG
jgi:hypothetical protein